MDHSTLRPPAVAGLFYPADPALLTRDIEAMLLEAGAPVPGQARPKALVVPHAGYIYSGPIAASAYATLTPWRDHIQRVILLGPTHRVPVRGLALPGCQGFVTPLGTVAVDAAAVAAVRDLPQVVTHPAAHAYEHALEVQLPFLQELLPHFTVLPLAVGDATGVEVAEVLERLWGGDETLIVISSDLSHYLAYADARHVDEGTAGQIRTLDAHLTHRQACGATPLNGLLLLAQRQHLTVTQLDLRNSGDTAGDKERVVGYGAFALSGGHHAH